MRNDLINAVDEVKEKVYRDDLIFFIRNEMYLYDTEAKEKDFRLGRLHDEWNDLIWDSPRLRILAPRDHLKTTFFSIAYPVLRCKLYPDDLIYIFSKTDPQAVKMLDSIKKLIKKSPFLQGLAGAGAEFWNKTEIRCANGATIYAQGYFSAIRGAHPKLIILDDPIDTQVVYSDEQNKKASERFFAEILPMATKDTQILVIGTIQRDDDLYFSFDPTQWILREYKAIVDEKKKLTLFPEKWDWESLMKRKQEISYKFGERFFLKEYMNQPIDVLGEIIKPEWIKYWQSRPEGLGIYQGWDLSVGKELDKGDYTACVTIAFEPPRRIYILDVYRARIGFGERLKMILEKYNEWKPVKIGIEQNVFQYDTVQTLKIQTALPVFGVDTITNKVESFQVELAPLFESGDALLKPGMEELRHELLSLPRGSHDDMADALKIAIKTVTSLVEPDIRWI